MNILNKHFPISKNEQITIDEYARIKSSIIRCFYNLEIKEDEENKEIKRTFDDFEKRLELSIVVYKDK